jgi:sec-independent protein translocase protein TatB
VFDVAPTELLLLGAVAVAVIPPKDLPRAMRFAGQWIGKARGMARHFRSGLDEMIRQAELEEIEKKWREENERIMREHPLHDAIEHPVLPADAGETGLPAEAGETVLPADAGETIPPADAGETTAPAALPAPEADQIADMIEEPAPPEARGDAAPLPTADNVTGQPPLVPEGSPPISEPAPRRARAPKAEPAADENGPELPFDLPPQ